MQINYNKNFHFLYHIVMLITFLQLYSIKPFNQKYIVSLFVIAIYISRIIINIGMKKMF